MLGPIGTSRVHGLFVGGGGLVFLLVMSALWLRRDGVEGEKVRRRFCHASYILTPPAL